MAYSLMGGSDTLGASALGSTALASALKAGAQAQKGLSSISSTYDTLKGTLSGLTSGGITLPSANSTLNSLFQTSSLAESVFTALTGSSSAATQDEDYVQTSNINPEYGAFKWVQLETTPESFVSPSSVLIFAGPALYKDLPSGVDLTPIGLCQNMSWQVSQSVTPVKEIRVDETFIFPGKSQPGSLSLTRLVGDFATFNDVVHGTKFHNMGMHLPQSKGLFGLYVMFLSPGRTKQLFIYYFERCAIASISAGIQAGDFRMLESVNIMFSRIQPIASVLGGNPQAVSTT